MSYVYRALNEYDLKLDPVTNGISNMKDIYELLNIIDNAFFYSRQYELNTTYKEYKKKFKKAFQNNDLLHLLNTDVFYDILQEQNRLEKIINNIKNSNDSEIIAKNLKLLFEITSTVNAHFTKKNSTYTKWISTTRSLECISKYYLNQDIHKVAIIKRKNGIMYDEFRNLSLDYSSKENILNEGLAINKKANKVGISDYRLTDINSMPINFAVKEQQIPFYNYISPESIIKICGPLEVDLLLNNSLSDKALTISSSTYNCLLHSFINTISQKLTSTELFLLNEHYKNEKSLSSLADENITYNNLLNAKYSLIQKIMHSFLISNLYNTDFYKPIKILEKRK